MGWEDVIVASGVGYKQLLQKNPKNENWGTFVLHAAPS